MKNDHQPQTQRLTLTGNLTMIAILACPFLFLNAFGQQAEYARHELVVSVQRGDGGMEVQGRETVMPAAKLTDIGKNTLIEFKARFAQGRVYTQWQVKGERDNGLFIVERSTDGKEFQQVGFKTGLGVPVESPILYCWIDDMPVPQSRYRLLKVYEDGRYYYSEVTQQIKGIMTSAYSEVPALYQ